MTKQPTPSLNKQHTPTALSGGRETWVLGAKRAAIGVIKDMIVGASVLFLLNELGILGLYMLPKSLLEWQARNRTKR